MSQVYHFQNFYVTRLREAVDASSTTIYVDNPPTISSGILVLEGKNASKREIIYFSSVSGYTLNDCVRGLEGTIPNTHSQGSTIEQAVTAGQLDQVLSPHILLQGLGNDENAAMSQDAVTRVFTKSHNTDGTLKDSSVTADKLDFATFGSKIVTNSSSINVSLESSSPVTVASLTVGVSGSYLITGNLLWSVGISPVDYEWRLRIDVNGVEVFNPLMPAMRYHGGTGNRVGSFTQSLNTGDVVTLRVTSGGGTSPNGTIAAGSSSLSIVRV